MWAMIAALLAMGETVATEDDADDEGIIGFSAVTTFGVMERRHTDDEEVDSTMSRFGVDDSPVDNDDETGGDNDDLIGDEGA
mmetsp:Transcript_18080/g.25672  ORF Transcript_18080/g.25672 Transcript_18080/m.25672 type:complete len:82 (-) Transcript_18080:798-1043(-)